MRTRATAITSSPQDKCDILARIDVVGMPVTLANLSESIGVLITWAKSMTTRYVCVANVHMSVESMSSPEFRNVVAQADMVTSDGMPLVWMLRALGIRDKERVCGRDLIFKVCERCEAEAISVGFVGGTESTLTELKVRLKALYPALLLDYTWSPPFGPHDEMEVRDKIAVMRRLGVKVLFVGLGCPKQELWMARYSSCFPGVMLGVGAAFDFVAGTKKVAPKFLQRFGLEWLHRLMSEPHRLSKRYLRTNAIFSFAAAIQLVRYHLGSLFPARST